MSRMIYGQRVATSVRSSGTPHARAVSVVEIPLDDPEFREARRSTVKTPYSIPLVTHAAPVPDSLITRFLRVLAKSVCVWTAKLTRAATSAPPIRVTVIAATIFLAAIITAHVARSEIDLTTLMPGASQNNGRPLIVVQNGKLTNAGDVPAINLEVTKPRYRLIGTLAPNQTIELPADNFSVQFEWIEDGQTKRATRSFQGAGTSGTVGGSERVAGTTHGVAAVAQSGASTAEPAPPGIAATYNPATHLLTVPSQKSVEVRVDGFLLRPVSRTDKEGTQYRYVQANVLVLGQDLRQGDTVTFEVVFTKPQDFYSIPIYVHEPGKPAAYFTVSVGTSPKSDS